MAGAGFAQRPLPEGAPGTPRVVAGRPVTCPAGACCPVACRTVAGRCAARRTVARRRAACPPAARRRVARRAGAAAVTAGLVGLADHAGVRRAEQLLEGDREPDTAARTALNQSVQRDLEPTADVGQRADNVARCGAMAGPPPRPPPPPQGRKTTPHPERPPSPRGRPCHP